MLEPPLWQQANKYSARLDRQFIEDIFDIEGVIKPTGGALLVTPRAAGANMSIDIAAGRAVIKGDDEANQGSYRVISTAVENRPVGAPPGSDSRIDLVVARVRDANVTGGVSSDWVIEIIPGAVAPTPVAPAVPATAIPLAQILVAAGTLSIDGPKITDRRTAAGNAAYAPIGFLGARILKTSNALVSNAAAAILVYSSAQFDSSAFWSAGAPSRLTVPAGLGGKYIVSARLTWDFNSTGTRTLSIRKNGVTVDSDAKPAGGATRNYGSVPLSLAAGDYIDFTADQDSGASLNVLGAEQFTWASIVRVGA